jgi:hypothetical protein
MTSPLVGTSLDGFDPLEKHGEEESLALAQAFEDANRRIVHNILKSYTGYFDLFSEVFQNALDAVQMRDREASPSYRPRIWVYLDMASGLVRVTDNGVGMNEEEFKLCLRPNFSFKRQADLRGHKGVGATFLAYGFSFIRLQSKQRGGELSAILRQGRQWAEDQGNSIPRPKFEADQFAVPELANDDSGTSVEILVGRSPGERPKNLGWIGAQTAEQWLDVFRIKTPLGGVYLNTPPFSPHVTVTVKTASGTVSQAETGRPEYYYPHEIENLKAASLSDINKALDAISGDPSTKFTKLPGEYKRLDCVYEIWDKDQLLADASYFSSALDDDMKLLIERHSVTVYAAFLRSAKLWGEFNDNVLKLRTGQRIIQGGLQIASDFMAQGELLIIPLTSTIGYQANSHVVVHFVDGNPDMGRKVFQPELKTLAEVLAVRSVNTMKRFLQHMRPDTGANTITPDRELHDWKKNQETHRDRKPLSFERSGRSLALVSTPQQEQDVVALFHELIGIGLLKGYKFYATSQSDRYDSLFFMDYLKDSAVLFDRTSERLGISRSFELPYTTEPKVLEYKYTFDSLVDDFDKEEKFAKQIDLVVCWTAGTRYKEKFFLSSLLPGDEGLSRELYGATHQAFAVGSHTQPAFEVLILEDLLSWLQNPADEEARQRRAYRDD